MLDSKYLHVQTHVRAIDKFSYCPYSKYEFISDHHNYAWIVYMQHTISVLLAIRPEQIMIVASQG